MGKVFAVTSGKGGVGKSTISVGLALAFCKLGKKTLLVDMDEGLRCLDLMLGVDKTTVFDLSDVLLGRDIEDTALKIQSTSGLFLLPAPAKTGLIDAFSFTSFAEDAASKFDTVIFDFPAGIDFTLYSCLPADTQFLTIAVPDSISVRDASAVSDRLESISRSSFLLINNFIYNLAKKRINKSVDEIIDGSGLQLCGIVPNSKELSCFSVKQTLKANGKTMAAFLRIAGRLNGEHIFLPPPKKI